MISKCRTSPFKNAEFREAWPCCTWPLGRTRPSGVEALHVRLLRGGRGAGAVRGGANGGVVGAGTTLWVRLSAAIAKCGSARVRMWRPYRYVSRNQSGHHLRVLHLLLLLQRRLHVRPAAAVPVLPGDGVWSFLAFLSVIFIDPALVPLLSGWGLASDSGQARYPFPKITGSGL
jgi:hypothetical protein